MPSKPSVNIRLMSASSQFCCPDAHSTAMPWTYAHISMCRSVASSRVMWSFAIRKSTSTAMFSASPL